MKISIVTISYNQAQFLGRCIDSVLGQDFENVEYIVVDAGSTDGSREIISSYGSRIRVIFERDGGPADGLNKGFAQATGDVFGFLNSDDGLLPGALSSVARQLLVSAADVVSGCGWCVDASDNRLTRIIPSRFTPWLFAHGAVTIFQQGTFFRASSFRGVGGFNPANMTCWDGEFLLDMAMAGARFATFADDLAFFRIHSGSISGSGRLNDAYRTDCTRLFVKAMGRNRRRVDALTDRLALVCKFGFDPAYLGRRLHAQRGCS